MVSFFNLLIVLIVINFIMILYPYVSQGNR